MRREGPRMVVRVVPGLLAAGMLAWSGLAWAEQAPEPTDQVVMTDGTTVTGKVVRRYGGHLLLLLPRTKVATVNGQTLPPPVIEGQVAPEFRAVDLAGVTHALSENRGQVTLLQFWATWCPHCRHDLPLMKQLSAEQGSKGLRILTVSIDANLAQLKQFLDANQITYPVIAALSDTTIPNLFEAEGVPAYFVIGADGKIADVWSGSLTEEANNFEKHLLALVAAAHAAGAQNASAGPTHD